MLIEIGNLGVLTDDDLARGRREFAEDRAQERGLAGAVAPDDAEALARREDEVEVLDQGEIANLKSGLAELEDRLPGAHRVERDLGGLLGLGGADGLGLLGALDPGLLLGAARLGLAAQPLDLGAEEVLSVALGAGLEREALGLGLEVLQIATFVVVELAFIELERPRGDAVEEVAIVGDQQDGARELLREVALQPLHRLHVEVVGRLVEHGERRPRHEDARQRDAAAIPPLSVPIGASGRVTPTWPRMEST